MGSMRKYQTLYKKKKVILRMSAGEMFELESTTRARFSSLLAKPLTLLVPERWQFLRCCRALNQFASDSPMPCSCMSHKTWLRDGCASEGSEAEETFDLLNPTWQMQQLWQLQLWDVSGCLRMLKVRV